LSTTPEFMGTDMQIDLEHGNNSMGKNGCVIGQ
jgi:hypothetical protein